MLLRHTTDEATRRTALTVNPAKTCQPIGAMYAALGVHRCLPHSHGSQGCCSYHRSQLTRHYKEPVMAATSSFTEGSAVFGGQSNLLQAIDTIFATYEPDVIAVHTTCLSETIGDDLVQIVAKARTEGRIPEGKDVFFANTPSYQGSHVTGFAKMVKSMVDHFAQPSDRPAPRLALFPGWVEPADMREMRRLAALLGQDVIMAPDTSGVLDAGMEAEPSFYPAGGTTMAELRALGSCRASLASGPSASSLAVQALEGKTGTRYETVELPIGLSATDRWIEALRRASGMPDVPAHVRWERARLVDMLCDMQQYLYGRSVALWGDPDQLVSLVEFCIDMGMRPRYVVTGSSSRSFEERLAAVVAGRCPEMRVASGHTADMLLLHQWIKQAKVDLLIGGTHGKYIARDESIPLVRHGFPILDRVGHQYFPTVGYAGGMRLVEQILNAFLEVKDATCPEESFELVL